MAWYNPFSWFSGTGNTRREGLQTSSPGSYPAESAVSVNFDSAMTVSAFWACARLLSETLAAMPLKSYVNNSDGSKEEDKAYQLWRLLNYQPNRYQTRTEFFENLMLNLVTDGNFYARIVRTGSRITSILPFQSSQMQVQLLESGELLYEYQHYNNTITKYSSADIWHIKLFGNGIVGMSPLAYARNSLGVSIAAENRYGKLAKNGGKASGILTIDRVLTDQQRAALRKNMEEIASGDADALKILEADMKFQQISISPQDLQLLESRRFSIEEIARVMGVPSVLINDTSGSTTWGSGIEQIIGGFYKLNLKPYLERIESSTQRWLIPSNEWDSRVLEFDFDSLLRADPKTRAERDSVRINSGQLTPNEARNSEGLPDKEGGDRIFLNGALAPAELITAEKQGIQTNDNN